MENYIKIFAILTLTCFSFYYTDKVIDYSKKQNPIYEKILKANNEKSIESVNAMVEKDYIISGKNGQKIDIEESYDKMKKLGEYNDNLLIFINEYPDVSINNNYNKFIIGGNKETKNVSLIFKIDKNENIDKILEILKENNIKANFFIDKKVIEEIDLKKIINSKHYIGNAGDNENYEKIKTINNILENYTNYKIKYCLVTTDDYKTLDICNKEKMYTIKAEKITNNRLYNYVKNNLKEGKIFLINNNKYQIEELNLSIKYIKQKGYEIVDINQLLNV